MVQHATLSASSDIHVCKGADTAAAGQLPFFNGAGGQVNAYSNPHGMCYFVDSTLAAPYVLTYPSAYTKLAPTTIAGSTSIEVIEGTNARLTYTGAYATKGIIVCNISLDQASGADRNIGIQLYKNGSALAGSEIFTTTTTTLKQHLSAAFTVPLVQNDYIEAYAKNFGGSGDINVYSFTLDLLGIRG